MEEPSDRREPGPSQDRLRVHGRQVHGGQISCQSSQDPSQEAKSALQNSERQQNKSWMKKAETSGAPEDMPLTNLADASSVYQDTSLDIQADTPGMFQGRVLANQADTSSVPQDMALTLKAGGLDGSQDFDASVVSASTRRPQVDRGWETLNKPESKATGHVSFLTSTSEQARPGEDDQHTAPLLYQYDDIPISQFSNLQLRLSSPVQVSTTHGNSPKEDPISRGLQPSSGSEPVQCQSVVLIPHNLSLPDNEELTEKDQEIFPTRRFASKFLPDPRTLDVGAISSRFQKEELGEASKSAFFGIYGADEFRVPRSSGATASKCAAEGVQTGLSRVCDEPSSSKHMPMQTAPPVEVTLYPRQVPSIVVKKGPTARLPLGFIHGGGARPEDTLDSVFFTAASSCRKKAGSQESVNLPPPYSECAKPWPSSASPTHSTSQLGDTGETSHFPSPVIDYQLGDYFGASRTPGTSEVKYQQLPSVTHWDLDTDSNVYSFQSPSSRMLANDRKSEILDNDHQLFAFISCLFCWPIGLVAIYYSNMSQMLKATGNYAQARIYGRQAFIIASIGMFCGGVSYIAMLCYRKYF